MDVTEKLRAEATDSQRQADKHKATVSHLKDQVRRRREAGGPLPASLQLQSAL